MEDLTNQQIVLLAILVSFVTSMASAIITTSLLDEAPVQVGQTVNRVVERTIERVVPEESNNEAEIIRETIVVTEDDQVVDAIGKNESAIVRLSSGGVSVGVGFVVSGDGTIVTDGALVAKDVVYTAKTAKGDIEVTTVHDPDDRIAILKPTASLGEPLSSVTLGTGVPKLGQTIVALGGQTTNAISTGRVMQLVSKNSSTTTPESSDNLAFISTDIIQTASGSMLLNLSGEVVGIRIGALAGGDFLPSREITSALGSQ